MWAWSRVVPRGLQFYFILAPIPHGYLVKKIRRNYRLWRSFDSVGRTLPPLRSTCVRHSGFLVKGGMVVFTTVTDGRSNRKDPVILAEEKGNVGSVRWDPEGQLVILLFRLLIFQLTVTSRDALLIQCTGIREAE